MKFYINRMIRKSAWGGGSNFVTFLSEKLVEQGHIHCKQLEPDIDQIIMVDPRYEEGGCSLNEIVNYKHKFPNVKILHRINDLDKHRGTDVIDGIIMAGNLFADETVFISQWLKDYYLERKMKPKGICGGYVIVNGCDETWFYPEVVKQKHEKIRLVTHHWSNNVSKGYKFYQQINDLCASRNDIEFTFIGRYPPTFNPTHTKIYSPLYGKALGDELRQHDVYVTASTWEACGMHHIEGASCGLPVLFHENGGGINEICQQHGESYSSIEDFVKKLDIVSHNLEQYRSKINYEQLSASHCFKRYLDVIQERVK